MSYFKLGSLFKGISTTATAAGTTTLTSSSKQYQQFTGTQIQTIVLPDATTLTKPRRFDVFNRSTSAVTVNANGGSLVASVPAGSQRYFLLTDNSTNAGAWQLGGVLSSGSSSTVASSDKFNLLTGLASINATTDNIESRQVRYNIEEIGGDYWLTKANYPVLVSLPASFALNGFGYVAGGDTGSLAVGTNYRYSDDNDQWLQKATTSDVSRYESAASFLNGFGYISGGGNDAGTLAGGVEQYNDSTNAWSSKTNLITSRRSHSMFNLQGFVHALVGVTTPGSTVLSSNEVYSDVANAWYTRADVPAAVRDAICASLNDFGYVAGGSTTTATRKFTPSTNSWRTTNAVYGVGISEAAGFTVNGVICGAGGNASISSAYKYIDTFDTWYQISNLPAGKTDSTGFSLNNIGYTAGSSTGIMYSYINSSFMYLGILKSKTGVPTSLLVSTLTNQFANNLSLQVRTDGDTWKYMTSGIDSVLKQGETISAKFQPTGNGHVAGGHITSGFTSSSSVEEYNFVQNIWLSKTALSIIRYLQTGATQDGLGYSFGGFNGSDVAVASAEYRNEVANTSTVLGGVLPAATTDAAGGLLNGFIYSSGGKNGAGTIVNTHYRYNNTLDTYTTKTGLTIARAEPAAASIIGRYIVSGGSGSSPTVKSDSELYNDTTDSWTASASTLSPARYVTSGGTLEGFSYVVGGRDATLANDVNTAAKWNPFTDSFTNTATMSNSLYMPAVFHNSGFLFRAGGNDSFGVGPVANVQYYNPSVNTWTSAGALTTSRFRGSNNFIPGPYRNYELRVGIPAYYIGVTGRVWITRSTPAIPGGIYTALSLSGSVYATQTSSLSLWKYLESSDTWIQNGLTTVNRNYSTRFCLEGRGYYAGSSTVTSSTDIFNPITGTTISGGAMSAGIYGGQCWGLAYNGYGYGFGGDSSGGGSMVSTIRQYNTTTNSWSNVSTMSSSRAHGSAFIADSSMYYVGGWTSYYATTATMDKYNDAANASSASTSFVGGRASIFKADGPTPIVGAGTSNDGTTVFADMYVYSPSLATWVRQTDFPTANSSLGSGGLLSNGRDIITGFGSNAWANVSAVKNAVLGVALEVKSTTTANTGIVAASGANSSVTVGNYTYDTFTANGTYNISAVAAGAMIEVLVVGGGGAGSGGNAGGGGGGGVISYNYTPATGNVSITIGAGGSAHGTGQGDNGSNTVYGTLATAIGGGSGGLYPNAGNNGGCGGGASGNTGVTGGSGTVAQGYKGADCVLGASGGGGGAGGPAVPTGVTDNAGNGGPGYYWYGNFYGGGGGGGDASGPGLGGLGGGGAGGCPGNGVAGTANTGGGGGGGSNNGASGGSGVVIIRRRTS